MFGTINAMLEYMEKFVYEDILCVWSLRIPSVLVVVLICGIASASGNQQIYVAQSSSGDGSGSSANNCKSLASVNAVWPASAGDTVHLVGTLTNVLTVGGSGSAGNPVTILFEANAKFSAPSWPSGWTGDGAITIMSKNYITIDGGANGLIEATDNGTGRGNQNLSRGVGAASSSHLTIKNLSVINMYVRTSSTDSVGNGVAISDICTIDPYYITDFLVTNCTIRDACIGIQSDYGVGCSNYTFIANTISGVNWGGNCADRGVGATMTGLIIAANTIYSFTNWDDTVNNNFHHNGFYGWAESGGKLSGVRAYGNIIGPGFGGVYQTAGLFFSGNAGNGSVLTNVLLYNNLFRASAGEYCASGFISSPGGIFNNTFLGGGAGFGIGSTRATILNNLFVNMASAILDNYYVTGALVSDTNMFYGLSPSAAFSYAGSGSSSYKTLAQWQSLGFDTHSTMIGVPPNSDGTLPANHPVFGSGANLSNIFSNDFKGAGRTVPWSIGAYQTTSLQDGAVIGISPSKLDFGGVLLGLSTNLSFTIQNLGTGILTGNATVIVPFRIVAGGFYSLTAGQSQIVTIGYSPTSAGTNTQTVSFTGGNGANAELDGIGLLPSLSDILIIQAGAANITAPFTITNGYFSQPIMTTDPASCGRASFIFTVSSAGNYVIQAMVRNPSGVNGSFSINLDAEPIMPTMIWDIGQTSGFEQQNVSWRRDGTNINNQFTPIFALSSGVHQVIVRGRDANTQLSALRLLHYISPAERLRFP